MEQYLTSVFSRQISHIVVQRLMLNHSCSCGTTSYTDDRLEKKVTTKVRYEW